MVSLNLEWFQHDGESDKDIVDFSLFKKLINNGDISVNEKYGNGYTALHIAIKNGK